MQKKVASLLRGSISRTHDLRGWEGSLYKHRSPLTSNAAPRDGIYALSRTVGVGRCDSADKLSGQDSCVQEPNALDSARPPPHRASPGKPVQFVPGCRARRSFCERSAAASSRYEKHPSVAKRNQCRGFTT
ncbi:unnamed protein product, partial [Iphiclides podalirius]